MDATAPQVDYRSLLESIHAIVWRADPRDFQTTFASKEAEEILGYPASAWTGVPGFWVSHIHPDDRARVLEVTSTESRAGRSHDIEYRMIRADGEVVWLRNIVKVICRDGVPTELAGVTVDITKRRRSELEAEQLRQELIRVARASTLGEAAAAVAHEVNQPLAAIVANAETLQRILQHDEPARSERLAAIAEDIRADARRAGDIVHRIHAFVERRPVRRERIDVASVVEAVLKTVRALLASRQVECTVDIPASLPTVAGDAVEVQQVLLNLIRNAIEAIVDADPPQRSLMIRGVLASADRVELSVSDTGNGIAPEIRGRLFEPFATTKNGGLGMGLAVCRRIVEAHGGTIRADGGRSGATVAFTLPIADAGRGLP